MYILGCVGLCERSLYGSWIKYTSCLLTLQWQEEVKICDSSKLGKNSEVIEKVLPSWFKDGGLNKFEMDRNTWQWSVLKGTEELERELWKQ